MNYSIEIPSIYCNGCASLIKMTLEEELENIEVNQDTKIATFISEKNLKEVKNTLEKLFEELKEHGYSYINLKQI